MAYLSKINAFSISFYCHSDVKTQSICICANTFFSMPYSKFDIIDVFVFPFLPEMTSVCYNPESGLDLDLPRINKTGIFLTGI